MGRCFARHAMPLKRTGALLSLMLLTAAALYTGVAHAAQDPALVKKGEYLARAGDCYACHTMPGGKPFAGGSTMNTPFGSISVPNITPDEQTGIGNWTDDEFYRAMHEGVRKDGAYLYPVFPFPWYTKVSRDDVMAIKAYLFSLPPENAPRKPIGLRFPYNIRDTLGAWRTLFFKANDFKPDPKADSRVNRGAYLVEGLGHCGECHNRHNVRGASQWSGQLEGGEIEGWYAPNLTSDGKTGIGNWSEDDLATFLKTGTAPGKGVVLGPMAETVNDSLRYLTDDDLHAIAAYLKSVPAHETGKSGKLSEFTGQRPPGSQAYLSNCAYCHQSDGKGIGGEVPALASNGAVASQGPQNVLRIVLGGLPATHGFAPMPAMGASMTDQEVADVVDYVRNSWGNAAATATGGGLVHDERAATHTLMAGDPAGGCPASTDPQLTKLLDAGGAAELKSVKQSDLLQVIDDLVGKLKQAEPSLSSDAVVNELTQAYCPVVTADAELNPAERARRIGNFAVLVYGQTKSAEFQ